MRYKEFNNKRVLEDCISLFWENSFNGTPINTIVKHTRVNRFSLYNEFENKQGILYEGLKLYKERYSDELIKQLESSDDLNTVLKSFFFSYLSRDNRPPGCFIIYTSSELADNDEFVNSLLKKYLHEIESKFILLLNRHRMHNSEAIANNLILLFCNSMCYCHIQNEKECQEFISLNLDMILNN
jgi:AcrR family transcriptional regulator